MFATHVSCYTRPLYASKKVIGTCAYRIVSMLTSLPLTVAALVNHLSHILSVHAPMPHTGEKVIGARAYRVMFALVSLPLAVVALVYFINHRYDGTPLWDVRGMSGVHELVWLLNFVSFYFLYPSTFNILEVGWQWCIDEVLAHGHA